MDPATVNCISAPAQGDGEQNRDGKKMVITAVHVKGQIRRLAQTNQTSVPTSNAAVVALVLDTQSNGAQINSEDVYEASPGGVASVTMAQRNMQYSSRFKVLKYKRIAFDAPNMAYDGTNIEVGGQTRNFKFDLSKCKIPVNFTSTTEGLSNVTDNSLHVIAFADVSTAPDTLQISYNSRIRFVG
jgi:hypothetical protein